MTEKRDGKTSLPYAVTLNCVKTRVSFALARGNHICSYGTLGFTRLSQRARTLHILPSIRYTGFKFSKIVKFDHPSIPLGARIRQIFNSLPFTQKVSLAV